MTAFAAYYIPQYRTTTLNKVAGLTAAETAGIKLASIPADLDITKAGICALTYSNPIVTTTIEWITYTSIDGTNVLQGVTRGAEGWDAKTHENGCTIGFVFSKSHINAIMDALTGVTTGVTLVSATLTTPAITATSAVLTTPKITTSINDSGGNEVIKTPATGSAVNEITVTNAATGNDPQISATGGDDNIGLKLATKGTKSINMSTGWYQAAQAYAPAGAGTSTLNLALGNEHVVTMPANTQTLAISNGTVGQKFIVSINNVTSQGALTWFTTIKWAGGTAPTLTGTNGKRDTFGFIVTGTDTYDGFFVGQNL